MPTNGAFDVLKPFAWLAAIAFVVGFFSYLVLGQPSQAVAQDHEPWSAAVSGPSSDEWNIIKHI